jgi:signal transduction histidine kinase
MEPSPFRPQPKMARFKLYLTIPELELPSMICRISLSAFTVATEAGPQGGVGLGLSLAKAYTDAMNGFINVTSALNKGSTFTLSFVQ